MPEDAGGCRRGHNPKTWYPAKTYKAKAKSRKEKPSQASSIPKRELAEEFFAGKCRSVGVSTMHDCKVATAIKCCTCKKTRNLAKICPRSAKKLERNEEPSYSLDEDKGKFLTHRNLETTYENFVLEVTKTWDFLKEEYAVQNSGSLPSTKQQKY